jgi:hypothetical protein
MTPDRWHIVKATSNTYPYLLTINTYASCFEFVQRVLEAMPPSEEWGHLSKDWGEAGYTYNGVRVSHDVIVHKGSGAQVDIIVAAAARSDPDPKVHQDAKAGWEEIPRHYYRPHNVWVAPIPVPGGTKPDPKPDPSPPPPATCQYDAVAIATGFAHLQAQISALADAVRASRFDGAEVVESLKRFAQEEERPQLVQAFKDAAQHIRPVVRLW